MHRKDHQKLNNRGFSLVELIVAVAILAIVTVPLLRAFVTSARTTSKATEVGRATLAAQNIYESIQAVDSDGFDTMFPKKEGSTTDHEAAAAGDLTTIFGASASNVKMEKKAEKEGVENAWVETFDLTGVSAGGRSYDAAVTLDASPARLTADPADEDENTRNPYYKNSSKDGVNDIPLTTFTQFDNVFTQTGSLTNDPDDRIDLLLAGLTDASFSVKRRTIELSFEYEDTDKSKDISAGDTVKPVVAYCYYVVYSYKETTTVTDETNGGKPHEVTTEVTETLDGTDMSDSSLEGRARFTYHMGAIKNFNPAKNFRFWLFYKPYYEGTGTAEFHWVRDNDDTGFNGSAWHYPASKDLFLINNKNGFKADICLIPQEDSIDHSYSASVRLFEPGDGKTWNMDIWSNMGKSVTEEGKTKAPISDFYLLRFNRAGTRNAFEAIDSSGVIKKIAGDRLVRVKIEVYKSGHSASDKALYTLNGVKLR